MTSLVVLAGFGLAPNTSFAAAFSVFMTVLIPTYWNALQYPRSITPSIFMPLAALTDLDGARSVHSSDVDCALKHLRKISSQHSNTALSHSLDSFDATAASSTDSCSQLSKMLSEIKKHEAFIARFATLSTLPIKELNAMKRIAVGSNISPNTWLRPVSYFLGYRPRSFALARCYRMADAWRVGNTHAWASYTTGDLSRKHACTILSCHGFRFVLHGGLID